MSPDKVAGLPSQLKDESFHKYMLRLYQMQRETSSLQDVNQYHVQAKLPPAMYRDFYESLIDNDWSVSTGVQYAIYNTYSKEQAS